MITIKLLNLGHRKFKKRYILEKRDHKRAKTRNLVRTVLFDRTFREQITNLIDLSESGLQFFSKFPVAPGTMLEIIVSIPEKKTEIPVIGKVMWMKRIERGELGYRIGVHFEDMQDRDGALIRDYVIETRSFQGKH